MEAKLELCLSSCIYLINPREIRGVKYYQTYRNEIYSPMEEFKELSDENKKYVKKIVEIEMYGKDNNIRIDVSDDKENELYKEIRQKLARKFGMNLRNNKNNEYIITLFKKGIEVEQIAEILKMRKNNINKIIEEYKSKKKRHITGLYAFRAFGPPGFRSPRSVATLLPTAHSTHIFASPGNLRFPLSGLPKRHIQPGRYVQ
jgi:hypothetical protein